MLRYIIRRIGYMLITLWFISLIGFAIIQLPKGSYVDVEVSRLRQVGGEVTQEQIRALEIEFGRDIRVRIGATAPTVLATAVIKALAAR